MESTIFEVETRLWFHSPSELFQKLPFLEPYLIQKEPWVTTFYGLELFKSGKLLRIAEIFSKKEPRYYLGWKGIDLGKFANIREELHEEITDGVTNSTILSRIGGTPNIESPMSVAKELARLGHNKFMDFSGENIVGVYKPLGLQVKLMACSVLEYPLLLEIEKTTKTKEDALTAEIELQNFIDTYHLIERIIRQEPPSLLYSVVFNH